MSYVVKYHPEGWRSAKDEPPEKDMEYYCALKFKNGKVACRIAGFRMSEWDVPFGVTVTHWTYLPTPPWEIFPKENTDA